MNRSSILKLTVSIVALGAVTVFAQGQTARWQKLLGNMMLSNVDAASTQGSGVTARAGETQTGMGGVTGVGDLGNVSGSSVMKLHLCGDKSFVLQSVDSASVPGVSNTTSSSKITGSWAIGGATQADAKVKLTPRNASDAKVLKAAGLQNFTVSFTGDRTFVNETRWYRMKSAICKK